MENNTIKKSELTKIIEGIIRGIVKENWFNSENTYNKNVAIEAAKELWGDNAVWDRDIKSNLGTLMVFTTDSGEQHILLSNDGKIKRYVDDKWITIEDNNTDPSENTVTGAVSPVSTPLKHKTSMGEAASPTSNEDTTEATKIANQVWPNQVQSVEFKEKDPSNKFTYFNVNNGGTYYAILCKDERGQWWNSDEGGVRAKLVPVNLEKSIEENIGTDAATTGYQSPGWVATKMKDHGHIEVLGYKLTSKGKKDMARDPDRLI